MMLTVVRVWDDPTGPVRVLIGGRALTLRREPAGGPEQAPRDEHLVAGPGETSPAWRACADVVIGHGADPDRFRASSPGCLVAVAVTPRICLVSAGDLEAWLAPALGGTCPAADAALYGSALHAWLVMGEAAGALTRLTLVRGTTVTMVRVRPRRVSRPATRRAAL